MDDQPGLFDLAEPERAAPPARSARGRARERFARRVVVDAVVVDEAVLRAEALRLLDQAITISEGVLDDEDDDLLTPEEEIASSVAAALQWCVEPTEGMWPLLEAGAVRIDFIDLAAEERGPRRVRVRWDVTVKIIDVAEVRELALAACPRRDPGDLRRGLAVGGGSVRADGPNPRRDLDVCRSPSSRCSPGPVETPLPIR